VEILPVLVRPVVIYLKVFLNRNELDTTNIREKIIELIYSIYDRKVILPGTEFLRARLSSAIEELSYTIGHVLIQYPKFDIYCDWNEILQIDDVHIEFERG
jgi:hypothetical protein